MFPRSSHVEVCMGTSFFIKAGEYGTMGMLYFVHVFINRGALRGINSFAAMNNNSAVNVHVQDFM